MDDPEEGGWKRHLRYKGNFFRLCALILSLFTLALFIDCDAYFCAALSFIRPF